MTRRWEIARLARISRAWWRLAVSDSRGIVAAAELAATRSKKRVGRRAFAAWRPIAPEGYVAVGCVVTPNHEPPDPNTVACVRADLAALSTPAPAPLWTTEGAESKLGGGTLRVYRTGVAAGGVVGAGL